ncbi:MAG: hypothetical protein ACRCWB_08560 [Enterovibrio sp.]
MKMITRNSLQNISLVNQLDRVRQSPAGRLSAHISNITISNDPRDAADSGPGRLATNRFCGDVLKTAEEEMFSGPLSEVLSNILNKASVDRGDINNSAFISALQTINSMASDIFHITDHAASASASAADEDYSEIFKAILGTDCEKLLLDVAKKLNSLLNKKTNWHKLVNNNVFLRDINKLGETLHAKLAELVEQNGDQENRLERLAMEAVVQIQSQLGVDDKNVTDFVTRKMEHLKSLTRDTFASEGRYRNELLGVLHALQESVGTPTPPVADTVRAKMRDTGTETGTDGIGTETDNTGVDQGTGTDGTDPQPPQQAENFPWPNYPYVLQGAENPSPPDPIPNVQYPTYPYNPVMGYFWPITYVYVPFLIPQQPQGADAATGTGSGGDSDSDSDSDDDDTSGLGRTRRSIGVNTDPTQAASTSTSAGSTTDSGTDTGGGTGTDTGTSTGTGATNASTGTDLSSSSVAVQTDPVSDDNNDDPPQPIRGKIRSFLDISLEAADNPSDMTMHSRVNPFYKSEKKLSFPLFVPLGGGDSRSTTPIAASSSYERVAVINTGEANVTGVGGAQTHTGVLESEDDGSDQGSEGNGTGGGNNSTQTQQRYTASVNVTLDQSYLAIARRQSGNSDDMTMMAGINAERGPSSRRSSSSSETEIVTGRLEKAEIIPPDGSATSTHSTQGVVNQTAEASLPPTSSAQSPQVRFSSTLNIRLSPAATPLKPVVFKVTVPNQGEVSEQNDDIGGEQTPLQAAVARVEVVNPQQPQTAQSTDIRQAPLQDAQGGDEDEAAALDILDGVVRQALLATQQETADTESAGVSGGEGDQMQAVTDLVLPFVPKKEGYLTIAERTKVNSGINDAAARRGANPFISRSLEATGERSHASSLELEIESAEQNTGASSPTPLQSVTIIETTNAEGKELGASVETKMDLVTGDKSSQQDKDKRT